MVTQPTEPTATPTASAATPTLTAALELLRPFARLLIGQGLKYAEAAEALKRAFVEASLAELARGGTGANTSRISVSTGLHRQDINRLLEQPVDQFERGRSVAAEVYTRWLTDSRYLSDGRPKSLPMRAEPGVPSFETLARSISTDVHPRTIAEELRRLGLMRFDGEALLLSNEGFVPRGEREEMLALLGANVGDHLAAAVANVLGDTPRRLEQAVYAEGLDDTAIRAIDEHVRRVWRVAMRDCVSLLERLIEDSRARADASATPRPGGGRRRVRIGMYAYDEPESPAAVRLAPSAKRHDEEVPSHTTKTRKRK